MSKLKIVSIFGTVTIVIVLTSMYFYMSRPIKYITCDNDFILEKNKCIKKINLDADNNITCDDEFIVENKKCIKYEVLDAISSFECPVGYSLKNKICEKYVEPVKIYVCPEGYNSPDGKICMKFEILENDVIADPNFLPWYVGKCKTEGAILAGGNSCRKVVTTDKIAKTSCSQGTLVGNKCYHTTSQQIKYSCLDEDVLENDKCKSVEEGKVYNNYVCLEGYQLEKDKCIKTDDGEEIINYTCRKGMALKNKKCIWK